MSKATTSGMGKGGLLLRLILSILLVFSLLGTCLLYTSPSPRD